MDCGDYISDVADGNAAVPAERKENATFLLAKLETRMVAKDAVTCMRHRCTTARSSNFC